MILPEQLLTDSLRAHPRGASVTSVLAAALAAVEPGAAVRRSLRRAGDDLFAGERRYILGRSAQVFIVGAGKAAAPMGQAAAEILGQRLTGGLLVTKDGYAAAPPGGFHPALQVVETGHPLPDERGVQAARRMAQLLDTAGPDDLVICLVSGGGSALLTAPAEGITLGDLQALTATLLACGASIDEINTLRKHLDAVKGGGLARWAAPAGLITLVLSDVIGDSLEVIASGPTAPDGTTFQDALQVLEKYQITGKTPPAILRRLEQGMHSAAPETPKPNDPIFQRAQSLVVGSNRQAAQAALAQARRQGLNTLLLTTYLQGEARQAGRFLAALGRELAMGSGPLALPACLALGGETTVTLALSTTAGSGLGGRNQEMALGAVNDLAGLHDVLVVTLATDGGDGPTDAAGAVASGETLRRAQALGLQPQTFLANHDAYYFFQALGDLLRPGPTQTNVNDLAFVFAFP